MTNIFIPYGTTEGQTAKIAEYIADVIRHHGHEAEAVDVEEARDTVSDDCDGVIVGGSIHMGKHDKHLAEFVRKNRDTLARLPSAFFSVSLAAVRAPVRRNCGTSSVATAPASAVVNAATASHLGLGSGDAANVEARPIGGVRRSRAAARRTAPSRTPPICRSE